MKNALLFAFAVSLVASGPAASAAVQEVEGVEMGAEVGELTLRYVLGGDGRSQLSEFTGQPLLIAHWTRKGFAPLDAVRVALDLEEKYAEDGLVVFLMAKTDREPAYMRALQMDMLPGVSSRLLLEQELNVVYLDNGFSPRMALIGVDGTLRYAGSYQKTAEIKKLVKEELKRASRGWGEDEVVRKARSLAFGEGELGAARSLLATPSGEEQLAAVGEIEARFASWKRSIPYRIEQGDPAAAQRACRDLAEAAAGQEPWVAEADALLLQFSSAELLRELELAEDLERLLKPLGRKAPKKGLDEKLQRFAEEAEGTRVGERAERLARAVAIALQELE